MNCCRLILYDGIWIEPGSIPRRGVGKVQAQPCILPVPPPPQHFGAPFMMHIFAVAFRCHRNCVNVFNFEKFDTKNPGGALCQFLCRKNQKRFYLPQKIRA